MRLFGLGRRRERDQLVSALHSLGPTSLQGLSAALSWPARRTERVVREVATAPNSPVDYDLVHHRIRLRAAVSGAVGSPTLGPSLGPGPTPERGPEQPSNPGRNGPAEAGIPAPRCPLCHRPMQGSGTPGSGFLCPSCGQLGAVPAVHARPSLPESPTPIPDRRSQEMFAAYVTSRPIPCPRCRTTLRHRGVGDYSCPGCGERVTFSKDGSPTVSRPASGAA
jgi:predicted RNA-binding Zn-ribbon protein involved in translation (DUF1610 family)